MRAAAIVVGASIVMTASDDFFDLVCRTDSTIDESLGDKGFLGRCCIHEHERFNLCFVLVESNVWMYLDGGRKIVELFDHCLADLLI